MRVLWFTNSPCGSIKRYGEETIRGGWLISLEDEVKKIEGLQLGVAFASDTAEAPFTFDGVKYYSITDNHSANPILRVINRYKSFEKIDAKRLPQLVSVVKDFQPDLVHVHGTEECFGLVADTLKEMGIPMVISIQGLLSPYVEKFYSGIPKEMAYRYDTYYERFRNVGVKALWNSYVERSKRERLILSKANIIFGRTYWDKACTQAINPSRKYYVVNEILRPEFYGKLWKGSISDGRNNSIKIVSTIAGAIYKGLETVLKAASILSHYSGLEFEWHIAGYNSQSKMVRLSEKVASIDSSSVNVIYHGSLNADSLSSLLCESDIYVQASHIENSPNSLCEAMLVGMPCIASNCGGTSSILEDGVDGVLYQDGDPYVLSGLIVDFVDNPEKTIQLASQARVHAQERHNKKRIVEELIEGYNLITGISD